LPETYARILLRVTPSQTQLVQMVLNFIAYSKPKLSLSQLKQVLSIPETGRFEPSDTIHEDAILRPCSSLIRKSPDGSSFVFAHLSVQDFLQSLGFLEKHGLGHFMISKSRCSVLLAKQSLRFLLLPNFSTRLPPAKSDHVAAIRER